MKSSEIRDRFLKFFEAREHAIIPSASVVPENDPSSLFTTAGMQPLVPYLLGQTHPAGRRLVNVQKCVRTNDIDEVGDATHLTFFQMLGNWALGDLDSGGYGKREAIEWSWQLLTNPDEGFGLDPNRLYITVFAGNDAAPRDDEAVEIWKSIGVAENRIYYLDSKANWWSPGDNGPCGPSSEMFYDLTDSGLGDLSHDEFITADDNQQVVEIWNDVFMQYQKNDGVVVGKLFQPNIDTGAGLERLAVVLQGKQNIYETDIFKPVLDYLKEHAPVYDEQSARIIADHLRASIFLIADGVVPSNTDQGYVLRKLLRRLIRSWEKIGLANKDDVLKHLIVFIVDQYHKTYGELKQNKAIKVILDEYKKFEKTLYKGLLHFERMADSDISGKQAFRLFSTFGFPIELTIQLAREKGLQVDLKSFEQEMVKHADKSKAASQQKFKGGLAGDDEMSVKYHTATHLLHAALREILGEHVQQKGSNITPERLRFDFSHPDKMTNEEKSAVEDWVNDMIKQSLPVTLTTELKQEALDSGAMALFSDKYGDEVTVYTIGADDDWVSKELCGGPHVANTSELGVFKIKKEEASSAGVRRIKAVLTNE